MIQESTNGFLSELALAMVERRDLAEVLDETVERLGKLLNVDRVALLLLPPPNRPNVTGLVVRAIYTAEGVSPIPGGFLTVNMAGLKVLPAWPEILFTSEAQLDPRLVDHRESLAALGTASLAAAPIAVDGQFRGFLSLSTVRRRRDWSAEEASFLSAAVRLVSTALKQQELLRDMERRHRLSETVARVTRLLNFRLHAPDVLTYFVEETRAAFPNSDGCVAYSVGTAEDSLRVAAACGSGKATQAAVEGHQIKTSALRCAGKAFRSNGPVRLSTSGLGELMDEVSLEERATVVTAVPGLEVRSLLAAPIRVAEKKLGVIELLSALPDAFSEEDGETLSILAEQAAIALRNARLIEELTRSNRLKDDFLANLSHEVRTPLTGIVGWAEVLKESHGTDPVVERALKAILGQAETLDRLLGELIDLSRIENFGLELRRERVSLPAVIQSALGAVGPMAEKRDVRIETDVAAGLPAMDADPARLIQVLWNLLSNAVKFSGPKETVSLRCRVKPDGDLELEVEDRGFGIESSFLPFVFDRFRQEESAATRRHGGLGVGLSIAKAIVTAHGGTISAFSSGRGQGSRFTVRFPASRLARVSSGSIRPVGAKASVAQSPLAQGPDMVTGNHGDKR
jgi:signal transduction histidine kinase